MLGILSKGGNVELSYSFNTELRRPRKLPSSGSAKAEERPTELPDLL